MSTAKCWLVVLVTLTLSSLLQGQQISKDEEFSRSETNRILSILRQDTFLKEVESTVDQRKQVKEILDNLRNGKAELYKGDLPKATKIEIAIEHEKIAFNSIYFDIFLEHQRRRLRELIVQSQLNSYYGSYSAFIAGSLQESLEISTKQLDSLKKIQSSKNLELEKECELFAKKVAKILELEREEAIRTLDDTQTQKLKEIIGDRFIGMELGSETGRILYRYLNKVADQKQNNKN